VTSRFRRRRLFDRSLAALLAVAVAVIGVLVYRSSDIRNTSLDTSNPQQAPPGAWAAASVPSPSTRIPTALAQKWTATTDPDLGAVVSESGVVITADQHRITAHDSVTGVVRWSYTRANRNLCAVGSGDSGPADMSSISGVAGIATVYAENGFCSQVMTFDPVNGSRSKVRTSPNQLPGSLVFGGTYAGWLGASRVEVWRYDLVRTIQYGEQINPLKSGQSRSGCTFTDLALAASQFATVEHCAAEGPNARVVLNFDDPGAVTNHPDGWDFMQHTIRVDINTGAKAARIVGVTADRVAVLVSTPRPAVVVYDALGKETARTPVNIPAADIAAADSVDQPARPTPSVQIDGQRLSLIGRSVLAISTPTIQAVPPATAFSGTSTSTSASAPSSGPLGSGVLGSGVLGSVSPPKTADIVDLHVDWVDGNALGLPAAVGSTVLLPTAKGLTEFDAATGPHGLLDKVIPINRDGYSGRVDVGAVGETIVEKRGSSVVAFG